MLMVGGAMEPCLGNREPIDYGSMPSTTNVALKEYTMQAREKQTWPIGHIGKLQGLHHHRCRSVFY
jgi:hypothetical protein